VTIIAFVLMVIFVGANVVAVKVSNLELAPFWGGGVRFALAALLFWSFVAVRRLPPPRGRALAGATVYGLLGFAAFFAFAYWGLVSVPASLAAVVFALTPLMTLILAVAQKLERFTWRGVLGGLVAAGGIVLAYGGIAATDVPVVAALAVVAAALCAAVTNIVLKRLPPGDPVATNAVATSVGALVLLGLSVISGESRDIPTQLATWIALGYLILLGTLATFLLFLFLLGRLPASTVANEFVLAPFVGITLGAAMLGERLTPIFAAGAALTLAGVYLGALAQREPS